MCAESARLGKAYEGPYSPFTAGGSTGCPPGVDPTIYSWFVTVDTDKSGAITAMELQQALTNGNWSHFNSETCRLMIGKCVTNTHTHVHAHTYFTCMHTHTLNTHIHVHAHTHSHTLYMHALTCTHTLTYAIHA